VVTTAYGPSYLGSRSRSIDEMKTVILYLKSQQKAKELEVWLESAFA
jgi:hypothetical protein